MGWFEKLNQLKKESGMTTDDIVAASGLSKGTLNKIFAGATKDPQLSTVRAIVHCLGYTLDDLDDLEPNTYSKKNEPKYSALEVEYIKKYRILDEHGKRMVDFVLNEEYKRFIEQSSQNVVRLPAVARDGRTVETELTQIEASEVEEMIKFSHSDFQD